MNKVLIGKVLRPRGLKGELKIDILTNKGEIFGAVGKLFIDNKEYAVAKGSVQNGYAYVFLSGVTTVELADKFRNKEIYINSGDIKLADNEVLSTDLISFAVLNSAGVKIGTVKSVENYGGGDFFDIALHGIVGAEDLQIPNEDEFITETNMKNKTITLTDTALTSETVL